MPLNRKQQQQQKKGKEIKKSRNQGILWAKNSGYQWEISCYHTTGAGRLSDKLSCICKGPVPTTNPVIDVTARLLQFYARELYKAQISQE